MGASVIFMETNEEGFFPVGPLCETLFIRGIPSLLLEGGSEPLEFISSGRSRKQDASILCSEAFFHNEWRWALDHSF